MKTRRFVAALVLGVFSAGMVGGCVSATVALSPDAAAFDGKRIAVFDVSETKRRLIWTIGIAGEVRFRQSEEMLQSLEQAFIEHGLFQILDRSQVMALVEDKNLSVPPRPSTQDAVKLARMAGLDGVVILDFHGEFSWATLFVDENYRATAKLIDVHPDGKPYNLCDGIIRARYRDSRTEPTLIERGKVYRCEIDLWVTSNVFRKEHRIRVEISSSNFPRFDRNPNSGKPFGTDTKLRKAKQTIYHDTEHPSHILLPVIP